MNTMLAKWSLSGIVGAVAAFLGWSGWLLLLLICCAVADWVTGSVVAWKQGQWYSRKAREGIMGKIGMFTAVMAAQAFDLLIGLVMHHLPMIELPFSYRTLLLPIVCIWYICTELGSIIENAGELGAPIPEFLKRSIALLKNKTEDS